MSDNRFLALDVLEQRRRDYLVEPRKYQPIYLLPCRNKVLIVTDAGGSFGGADFGLSALLDALAIAPGPWVTVQGLGKVL